jgi:glycine cleavage system regulatory protein
MESRQSLVVIFSGVDRPGIVDSLSRVVSAQGGNWEQSRMARLADRFAGILEITAAASQVASLTAALEALSGEGVDIRVERGASEQSTTGARALHMEVTAADRPGIVREISGLLASYGLNIEDLHTATTSAPMSGEPLFVAAVDATAPTDCDLQALQDAVERLSDELVVDITLELGA